MNRPAFAPGVIEHHRRQNTRAHIRFLARWMARAAALVLLAAGVAAWVNGGVL